MLNFDACVKNSDAAQPRVTNVKTPKGTRHMSKIFKPSLGPSETNLAHLIEASVGEIIRRDQSGGPLQPDLDLLELATGGTRHTTLFGGLLSIPIPDPTGLTNPSIDNTRDGGGSPWIEPQLLTIRMFHSRIVASLVG